MERFFDSSPIMNAVMVAIPGLTAWTDPFNPTPLAVATLGSDDFHRTWSFTLAFEMAAVRVTACGTAIETGCGEIPKMSADALRSMPPPPPQPAARTKNPRHFDARRRHAGLRGYDNF
jgi:hypothetical protein